MVKGYHDPPLRLYTVGGGCKWIHGWLIWWAWGEEPQCTVITDLPPPFNHRTDRGTDRQHRQTHLLCRAAALWNTLMSIIETLLCIAFNVTLTVVELWSAIHLLAIDPGVCAIGSEADTFSAIKVTLLIETATLERREREEREERKERRREGVEGRMDERTKEGGKGESVTKCTLKFFYTKQTTVCDHLSSFQFHPWHTMTELLYQLSTHA